MNQYIVTFDSKTDEGERRTYIENISSDDFELNGSTAIFYKLSEGNGRIIKLRAFSNVWEISLVENDYLA